MIVLPIIIEGINTRKDKTIGLRITTQELSPETASELLRLNQKYAFCAIKENDFLNTEKEILESAKSDMDDTGRTPGQRLRSVIHVLWEQKPEGFKDSETFYRFKMDTIINHYKSKLL
jgi:hypothetical protein